MWGQLAGAGLGALLGSMAGGQGQSSSVRTDVMPEGTTGVLGRKSIESLFPELQQLMQASAGQQDVAAGLQAQRGYGDVLAQYAQGGFLPTQADFATANQFAQQALAPQQVAMQQAFEGEQQRTAQLAAQLGRPVNDPILQAKLAQEQMRGQERLGASQAALSSEFAQKLPMQRLQFTGQLADVRSQLASQAMANRQALIGLGSQLQQADQSFRMGTATKSQSQSGGTGGLMGAIAGAGAFMNLGNMFSKGFGGTSTDTGTSLMAGSDSGGGLDTTGWRSRVAMGAPAAAAAMPAMQQFNTPAAAAPYYLAPYVPHIQPSVSLNSLLGGNL